MFHLIKQLGPTDHTTKTFLLSTVALLLAASAHAFEVPLLVRNDQGIARNDEPVASGIPLPHGAVRAPDDLRLVDDTGAAIPCQAHQLALSWPDGSVKGEPFVEIGLAAKAGSKSAHTMFAGYCNGILAYWPTAQTVAQGGMAVETAVTTYKIAAPPTADAADMIVAAFHELLKELETASED